MHEDAADLISNLPDPVLLLILSGLRSTKELIRTSILSRRWRYLWTSLPSLDFKYQGRRNRSEKSKFKNIVYWALLHRSVDLDSFRLSCSYDFSRSTLERWIHASVMRNVKQLDFSFRPKERPDDMVMPTCLVTCASLEVFKLHLGSRLIVPSFSGFPSLRVLMLDNVEMFNDGIVKYFLESCPLLEDLTLDDCNIDKLDLLCISSPKLKKLSFWYPENDDFTGCLKVSCPKLVFLGITGLSASDYIFEGHSLKEAVIDDDCEKISKLLHKISYLESLRTNLCFLYYECIGDAPDLGLPNLKNLELTTINGSYTVRGLKQILKICPKLESLCLTFENSCIYEDDIEDYDETENPNLDGVGTWNLTPDVAWVEFFEFNGEKPKLTISWSDKNKSKWMHVVAKWGNGATFFH